MKKRLLLPVWAAFSCAALADYGNRLEEIVVISSRVPVPLREVGTSVSVITAEEIQARGFIALHDILRTQPGLSVSNSGGAGTATAVKVRGEEGFRTKLYLDGIDVSDTAGVQVSPRFEHLLSSGISRVEILRGPQGFIYGADAGGVINVSTDTNRDGLAGALSVEGGRYDTQQVSAGASGGNGLFDFALSALDYSTDGFNSRTDDTDLADDDGYDNTSLHARLGLQAGEDLRFELVAHDTQGETEFDGCYDSVTFAFTHDCEDEYDLQAWRAAAELVTGVFTHELAYTGNETERKFFSAGVPSFAAEGELEKYSYLGRYAGSGSYRVVYGVDLLTEKLDDGATDHERGQDGYYLEYQGNHLENLYLTAGVRYDDNEDFGSHTTYRVSGAWLVPLRGGELKLKATYGTGFRAPSLFEIAYNDGAFAYPPASDTELEEEESEGYDIGLVWATDDGLYLEAIYFDQQVENEIFFDQLQFSGYLQGQGEIDSSGIELAAVVPLTQGLILSGNYTYNDTEQSSGEQRFRRPEHVFNLGLSWRTLSDRLVLGANVRGSYDAVEIDGQGLDDYEVVDINASYTLGGGLSLFARMENLFDEDYEEIRGFNTSGAAAYAGARYSF